MLNNPTMFFFYFVFLKCSSIDKEYIETFRVIFKDFTKHDFQKSIRKTNDMNTGTSRSEYLNVDDVLENKVLNIYISMSQEDRSVAKNIIKINFFKNVFTENEFEEVLTEIHQTNCFHFKIEDGLDGTSPSTEIKGKSKSDSAQEAQMFFSLSILQNSFSKEELSSYKSIRERIEELKKIGFFKQVRFGKPENYFMTSQSFKTVEGKNFSSSSNQEQGFPRFEKEFKSTDENDLIEIKKHNCSFKKSKQEFKEVFSCILHGLKEIARTILKNSDLPDGYQATSCFSDSKDNILFPKDDDDLEKLEPQLENLKCEELCNVGEAIVTLQDRTRLMETLEKILFLFEENSRTICDIIGKYPNEFSDPEKFKNFFGKHCDILRGNLKNDDFIENLDCECEFPFKSFLYIPCVGLYKAANEIERFLSDKLVKGYFFTGYINPHTEINLEINSISIFTILKYFRVLLKTSD